MTRPRIPITLPTLRHATALAGVLAFLIGLRL